MKLTLSLLFVCVSVMVCNAAPAVEDDTALASAVGEDAVALADAYKGEDYRAASGLSGAKQGVAMSRARIFTSDAGTQGAPGSEKLAVVYEQPAEAAKA